ncbi:MAG: phosphoglycerate dehydrogenase [Methermicoccaceae archaeon]
MQFNVLVSDPLAQQGIDQLKEKGLNVDVNTGLSEDELCGIIEKYDALVVRSGTKVTQKIIEAAPRLKIIGRAGVGVDNIDVQAATRKGIVVVNAPEGNTISAAEHTVALMLSLARNIPQAHASTKKGEWKRKAFMGSEVRGKTIGIIGLGRIGAEVAKRCSVFQMNVLGYDPYLSKERADELGVRLVSLDELIEASDFITVHTPHTKDTHYLIDRDEFSKMKKSARVINCARGGIINEKALYEALKEGEIVGAALDVYESEPPEKSPLLTLDNIVFTPHLGASTQEAQVSVAVSVAADIAEFLDGRPVLNAINMPSIRPDVLPQLKPCLKLAERLGKFASQLAGHYEGVEITLSGELAIREASTVKLAALKGLLEPVLGEGVNYVNAELLMKERRVDISTSQKTDALGDGCELSITITSDGQVLTVSGGVHRGQARLLKIDDYPVDIVPEGFILVLKHIDKPNIIGPCCVVLGEININIAGMQVGRLAKGGESIMVLSVDSEVPDEAIEKMESIDGVLNAKQVVV